MDSSASTNPAAPEPPPPPTLESADEPLRLHAQLLACVRESVVASDLEGRILYWGPGAERMYGYKTAEVLLKPYRNFAGAIDPPDEATFRRELLARGYWEGQHLQKRRNGQTFWTETHISVFTDDQGQPAGFVGIDRDISGHKQAEEKLRINLERLQDIAANIPGAIYQLQTGRTGALEVPYMSSGCEALFERSVAEMDFTGLLFDRMHVGDRALFEHSLAAAAQKLERWGLEFRIAVPDGRTKWLRASANPRKLASGAILWNGVLLDVTRLKEAEDARRESEERFRLLVRNSSDVIAVIDAAGALKYVSPAEEPFSGFRPEELAGKAIRDVIHPDDWPATFQAFQTTVAQPDRPHRIECRHVHKTKGWIPVEVVGQSFLSEPAVKGVIVSVRDVSERHKAEEDMARQLDELRRWYAATLGREGRIAELKREVNARARRLGEPAPYPSAESAGP